MAAQLDEYISPNSTRLPPRFPSLLALSLLLHAIALIPALAPGHIKISKTAVKYIDLDMISDVQSAIPSRPAPHQQKAASAAPLPAKPGQASEVEKLQDNMQKTLGAAPSNAAATEEASFGLGMTNGYFSSIADGQSLRGDIREYYFEILRRVNEKWWLNKDGKEGGARQARFFLVIAKDGTLINKILLESSGNPAYDRAMMQTLDATSPFPPLPATFQGQIFEAPLRFNAPLNLMGSVKTG